MVAPTLLLAFTAGVLSLLSPCVLPLVPVYLSYLGGVTVRDGAAARRGPLMAHAGAFLVGFSVIFLVLGVFTAALTPLFLEYQDLLRWVGGTVILVMALSTLGVLRVPLLMREARVHLREKPAGLLGSVLVGLTFSAGWTPCIGPVLASVLMLSASSAGGRLLLLTYVVGFALPFLALAWSFGRVRMPTHLTPMFERVSGGLMLVMGLLLVTGGWAALSRLLVSLTGFQGF